MATEVRLRGAGWGPSPHREAPGLWSAVTCHRFSAGDSSPVRGLDCFAVAGRSGDKSPEGKRRQIGALQRFMGSSLAFCVLLWLGFGSLAGAAPLTWRWSNPKPHGGNVVDMAFSSALGLEVQVAERGQIYASYDLNLWVPRASGTTDDLRAVTFFNGRILVTGAAGRVLYADGAGEFQAGVLAAPTADWLESVTASASLAVAVGDNGAVYTSTNGIHWKRQNSGTTEWLRGVTVGLSGFMAVGENGRIIASVNGTNWVARNSGTTSTFNRVAYSPGRYTAVAEGGVCRFSTNGGVAWFSEVTGAVNDLFCAVSNDSGQLAVGDYEVRLREPGGGWSNELNRASGPVPWTYYTSVARPEYFLVAGRTGLMEECFKTNGTSYTWSPLEGTPRSWLWDVANPTNLYVAVGDRATIMTSAGGGEWKLEVVPPPATNAVFLGVGGSPGLLIAVGNQGTLVISPNVSTNVPVVSTNQAGVPIATSLPGNAFGVIWTAVPVPTTNDLQGVSVSPGLSVVTGGRGTILTSGDGTNWTQRASPVSATLSSVTAWPRGWVATGDDGAIVVSTNGTTWTLVPPPTTNWLYRVRHVGGQLVAVGQNGTILTSTDGISWAKRASGSSKWLNDICWVQGTWYAVGNGGAVLASTNLSAWIDLGTITRKNLYGAATDGAQLIAVGLEGSILRAQVAPDPTPIRILSYDRVASTNLLGQVTWQNIFLFGGQPDQEFTLDYRATFETNRWVTGPLLDFFDGSSTLYYLESYLGTNPPAREYYRATLAQ